MSSPVVPALDQALAALRTPGLLSAVRDRPLPHGIGLLLRIMAGDHQALGLAASSTGEEPERVIEAAELFIQLVLFHPTSDSYRVLGVESSDELSKIKEHYRSLVRWVHPDRQQAGWNSVYADRVNGAWNDLRSDARRAAYDASRAASPRQIARGATRPGPLTGVDDEFHLSTRTVRRLPVLMVASLVLLATLVLTTQAYITGLEREGDALGESAIPATAAPSLDSNARPTWIQRQLHLPQSRAAAVPAAPTPAAVPAVATAAPLPVQRAPQATAPVADPKPIVRVETPVARIEVTPPKPPTADRPKRIVKAVPEPAIVPERALPGIAAPTREPPPAAVAQVLIDEASAHNMILRFRSAYSSGNLHQVSALFATEPGNLTGDRKRILKSYGELFEASTSRRIELQNPSWLTQGDTAVLIATFNAYILPRNESEGHWVSGDIRFDLRREDGELRIVRLRHDVKGS